MQLLKKNPAFGYLLLFSITFLSINQFFLLAMIHLAENTANPATSLGNTMTLLTITKILILPLAGYLVDIFKEKKILFFSSIGFSLFFLLIFFQNMVGSQSNPQMYLYAVLSGLLLGMAQPAMYSVIPKIISGTKKTEGNSLFQTSSQLSQFIIPTVAAFFISHLSLNSYYFSLILLSLLCVAFASKINLSPVPEESKLTTLETPPLDYKKIIGNKTILSLLFLTAMINFSTSGPLQVTLPTFISLELNQSTAIYGYFMSIYGLGSFLGSFLSMYLPKKYETFRALLCVMFAFGLTWATVLQSKQVVMVALSLFIAGLLIGIVNVLFMSVLQNKTPRTLFGRVTSIQFFFSSLLTPFSFFVTGKLTGTFSAMGIYLAAGSLVVVSVVMTRLFHKKANKSFVDS